MQQTQPYSQPAPDSKLERRDSIIKPEDAQLENFAELDGDNVKGDRVDYSGFAKKSDPVEIKLVRKMDIRIMLSLWSMYWLNYLVRCSARRMLYAHNTGSLPFSDQDRNAIALARLSSLEEDLGLTGNQYQTCVSILFVGYVACGVPSNMIISRVRPSMFLCGVMILWGKSGFTLQLYRLCADLEQQLSSPLQRLSPTTLSASF